MNKEQLNAIKERANKATEGPWRVRVSDAENNERYVIGSGGAFVFVDGHYHDESWCEISEADAKFIAHAREDVPKLVAEVERLNGLVGSIYSEDIPEYLEGFIEKEMGWCDE